MGKSLRSSQRYADLCILKWKRLWSVQFIGLNVYVYLVHQLNHANPKPDIATFDNIERAIDLPYLHSFFKFPYSHSFNCLSSFICRYLVKRSRNVSQITKSGTEFQHVRVLIRLSANQSSKRNRIWYLHSYKQSKKSVFLRSKGDSFTWIYNILGDTYRRRHVLWGYVIYLRYKTEFQFSCSVEFHVACLERLENASEE